MAPDLDLAALAAVSDVHNPGGKPKNPLFNLSQRVQRGDLRSLHSATLGVECAGCGQRASTEERFATQLTLCIWKTRWSICARHREESEFGDPVPAVSLDDRQQRDTK